MPEQNEVLAPQDLTYTVNFKKSSISIENYDLLKTKVSEYAAKYQNMIVNENTVTDAKDVRANLRKLKTAIDDKRKEVKREYDQPLKEFEGKVKALTGQIDAAIAPIDKAVKSLEVAEREKRHADLIAQIAEIAPAYNIEPEAVEPDPSWENATMWTKAGKPTVGLTRAIGERLKGMQLQQERMKADKAATEAYAKANSLDPYSWLQQIETGATFADLRVQMDAALMQRKQAEERAQHEKEAAEAIAKAKQEQIGGKTIDGETGEVITSSEQTTLNTAAPKTYTRAFRVTCTEKQMWSLADFMKSNGIQYESIKGA